MPTVRIVGATQPRYMRDFHHAFLRTTWPRAIAAIVAAYETSMQPVLSTKRYEEHEVVWGAEHEDVVTIEKDGSITFYLDKFHDIRPTKPIPEFPYSAT